jgi:methionyl-tRNA formyltransferase
MSVCSIGNKKVLHVFGGGIYVKYAIEIAKSHGWKIVLRTGERFLKDLENYDEDEDVNVLVGNSLTKLIEQGGTPEKNNIGISFSAPWVIPKAIIDMFNGHLYNLHNQPLPRFRGGGGSSWNILMHDRQGGSSIHLLVPEIDAGPIFASTQFIFPESLIYPKDFDGYGIEKAICLLNSWLPNLLKTGDPGTPVQNNDAESEYWPRLNANIHGWIDWGWSLEHILSFCNAFSLPHRGAKTTLNGEIIHLSKVESSIQKETFHPFQTGIIYKRIGDTLHVAHPDGTLIVEEFQFESAEFKILLGDRLHTPREVLEEALTKRIQYSPDGAVFNLKKRV